MGLTARRERGAAGWSTTGLPAARALVPVVLAWLRQRDPELLLGTVAGWPPGRRQALRRFLTSQGLAPLVADILARPGGVSAPVSAMGDGTTPTAPTGTDDTARWLELQLRQNRARMNAFADDLSAILAGAAAAGLPVMPLKGGLLAFTRHREPGLRPMADLDLLVRSADEPGLQAVLARLGYGLVDEAEARHRTFRRPGDRVVALDGTHPGNPRRVEVHTRVLRSVWLDRGGVDLAPYLLAAAREDELLGQPALVPSDAALLVDIASHASLHLMRGAGMLLHWYDVAALAAAAESLDDEFADWTYPALALSARAFPDAGLPAKVALLAPRVGASLTGLAEQVPLDDRAGLNLTGVDPNALPWLFSRWRRWRANPWLVRLAHPGLPVPLAYSAYLGGLGVRTARKVVRVALDSGR